MQLTVIRGPVDGGPFELREGDNVVGRAPDCDVCLPSKRVSRRHCVVSVLGGQVIARDLGSHNGIVEAVSGRRVDLLRMLPGGRIQVGDFLLVLEAELTESELEEEDEDDDVHIATGEIDDEADADTAEEELSLDDTASAIRAARRPDAPAVRRPAQPVLLRADRRAPSGRSRASSNLADDGNVALSASSRPAPLPQDDPTPRLNPPPIRPRPVAATPSGSVVPLPGTAADMDVPTSPGVPSVPVVTPVPRPARRPEPTRRMDPLRDPATRPTPARAVAEVRVGLMPWSLQAVGAVVLVWSLVVCAPFGGAVGLLRAQAQVAHDAAVREALGSAATLAARNAVPMAAGDPSSLDLSAVARLPGVVDARLTDPQGVVVAPPDKLRMVMTDHEAMKRAISESAPMSGPGVGDVVEVASPIRLAADKPVVGYAWIEFNASRSAAELSNPWIGAFAAVLVFGAGTLTSSVAAWWLVIRPIERLAFGAERLAANRIGQLPPVPNWEGFERIARALHELAARARPD